MIKRQKWTLVLWGKNLQLRTDFNSQMSTNLDTPGLGSTLVYRFLPHGIWATMSDSRAPTLQDEIYEVCLGDKETSEFKKCDVDNTRQSRDSHSQGCRAATATNTNSKPSFYSIYATVIRQTVSIISLLIHGTAEALCKLIILWCEAILSIIYIWLPLVGLFFLRIVPLALATVGQLSARFQYSTCKKQRFQL